MRLERCFTQNILLPLFTCETKPSSMSETHNRPQHFHISLYLSSVTTINTLYVDTSLTHHMSTKLHRNPLLSVREQICRSDLMKFTHIHAVQAYFPHPVALTTTAAAPHIISSREYAAAENSIHIADLCSF